VVISVSEVQIFPPVLSS